MRVAFWLLEYLGLLSKCSQFIYRYYFGRCPSEPAEIVMLPYCERSTRLSNRLHVFAVTMPRCYKDVCVDSFFPCTARLYNSLPAEHFLLTYDLTGFTLRVNRHLLLSGSI